MPYKDPEAQKEYQRRWMAQRRQEWFDAHGPCCLCGSSDRLQLDHEDPAHKVSHKVWSWSASRRSAELEKCRVLCYECHLVKSKTEKLRGEAVKTSKLTLAQVDEIRQMVGSSYELGRQFGVDSSTIRGIRKGKTWRIHAS